LSDVCEAIYHSQDKTLIGSLSSLPYHVGRSFDSTEAEPLHQTLRQLEVSHRFESNTPGVAGFQFDSRGNDSAIVPPMRPTRTLITKKSLLIGATGLLLVSAVCTVFYYFSSMGIARRITTSDPATSNSPGSDQEATVERLQKEVEYRRHKDFAWNRAALNLILQKQDAIRTFADSSAVLRYREGSLLNVRPNTLLIIGENPNPTDRIIQLQDGTVQAQLRKTLTPHSLSIETASGTLELKNPVGDEKDPKVETTLNAGTFTVAVSEGKAKFYSVTKNSPPVEIHRSEKIVATKDSVTPPQTFLPEIHLQSPSFDGALLVDPQENTPVQFTWDSLGENAHYDWRISTDPQMKEVLLQQSTPSNKLSLTYLDLGTLYWQVTAEVDGVRYQSPVWRVHVQKTKH